MDANQLAQTLVQRGGYNQTDAENAARGPRASELAREFGVSGGSQPSGGVTAQSAVDTAKQLRDFNIESAKPAIETLKSGIAPLKQRYTDLIASIKGQQGVAEQKSDITSAREMGRRGITDMSSTFVDQYQQQQKLPISTQYAGLAADTGLQATNAENQINQLVAQLQSGAGSDAVNQALALLGQQQQAQQQQASLAQALQIANMQNQPTTQKLQIEKSGNNFLAIDPTTGKLVNTIKGLQGQTGGGIADYYGSGSTTSGDSVWK